MMKRHKPLDIFYRIKFYLFLFNRPN